MLTDSKFHSQKFSSDSIIIVMIIFIECRYMRMFFLSQGPASNGSPLWASIWFTQMDPFRAKDDKHERPERDKRVPTFVSSSEQRKESIRLNCDFHHHLAFHLSSLDSKSIISVRLECCDWRMNHSHLFLPASQPRKTFNNEIFLRLLRLMMS